MQGKCCISSIVASQMSPSNNVFRFTRMRKCRCETVLPPRCLRASKYLGSEGLLVEPEPTDIENAWHQYHLGIVGQAGIVDQVSFQVMKRLGIQEAFTNDKHFEAAGFKVLF